MTEFKDFKTGGTNVTEAKKHKLTRQQKIMIICSAAITLCLLVLIFVIACSGGGGGSSKEKSLHLIENYIDRGFYDQAAAKLGELLEENPDDEDLWALMARLQALKGGSPDEKTADVKVNIDTSQLKEFLAQNGGTFDTSRLEELLAKNNAESAKRLEERDKLWAQERAQSERQRAEDKALFEKQREQDRLESEKRLAQERSENAKTMQEMQELLKQQQAQAEAEKAKAEAEKNRLEEQRIQQKAQEEQRKREEEERKAKEAELARKNAQLKSEIDSVNEAITLGKASLNSGNTEEALEHFKDAARKMPVSQGEPDFSGSKYSEMSGALWDSAQTSINPETKKILSDTAKTYAEVAVSKTPKDAASHYILGMYSYEKKDMPKALEELKKAVTYDSNNYLYYYNLGRVQYMLKKYSEAKSSFGTSCTLNNGFAAARYNLGLTNNKLNDSKSALSDFRKAHDIEPRHEKAFLEEARLLAKLGDLNGSISAYLSVIKINNINRDAINELATVYSRAKKFAEAETYYRKSLAILPSGTDDPLTYYNLSSVLYEEGKIEESINYAKKSYSSKDSIREAASKSNIVYNYALISEKTGDEEGAIRRYSEVLELNPNHIKTYINLGNMYMHMNPPETDTALNLFTKAWNLDRNNFEANNNLGSAYRQKKEYKEAITYFLNALKLDSRNNEVRMNLAQAYASDQQYDNAKTTYIDVLKQDQSDWQAYVELAKVCMTLNDNESAEKYLITVQTRKPDFMTDEVSLLLKSVQGDGQQ